MLKLCEEDWGYPGLFCNSDEGASLGLVILIGGLCRLGLVILGAWGFWLDVMKLLGLGVLNCGGYEPDLTKLGGSNLGLICELGIIGWGCTLGLVILTSGGLLSLCDRS